MVVIKSSTVSSLLPHSICIANEHAHVVEKLTPIEIQY